MRSHDLEPGTSEENTCKPEDDSNGELSVMEGLLNFQTHNHKSKL